MFETVHRFFTRGAFGEKSVPISLHDQLISSERSTKLRFLMSIFFLSCGCLSSRLLNPRGEFTHPRFVRLYLCCVSPLRIHLHCVLLDVFKPIAELTMASEGEEANVLDGQEVARLEDCWAKLPEEVQHRIFKHLRWRNLFRICVVCRSFNISINRYIHELPLFRTGVAISSS